MTSEASNIIRVKLQKEPKYGLGFLIRQRSKSPHVIVSDLVTGGMAAKSGLVQIGDIVLKVNDTDLVNISYAESVDVLKALPIYAVVVLILRGPEGYTSHLETRFQNDGTPRTVRITKPMISQDSFIDKIKKTFTGSTSPKPCHSKQTQANCRCAPDNFENSNESNTNKYRVLTKNDISNQHKSSNHSEHNNSAEAHSHFNRNHANITHYDTEIDSEKLTGTSLKVSTCNHNNNNNHAIHVDQVSSKSNDAEDKSTGKCTKQLNGDIIRPNEETLKDETIKNHLIDISNKKMAINATNIGAIDLKMNSTETRLGTDHQSERLCSRNGDCKSPTSSSLQNGRLKNGTKQSEQNGDATISGSGEQMANSADNVKKSLGLQRLTRRRASSPGRKFVRLRNVGEERPVCMDTLYTKAKEVSANYDSYIN